MIVRLATDCGLRRRAAGERSASPQPQDALILGNALARNAPKARRARRSLAAWRGGYSAERMRYTIARMASVSPVLATTWLLGLTGSRPVHALGARREAAL